MMLIKQINFRIWTAILIALFALDAKAQIAKDKQLHFAAGSIAGSAGYTYVWQKTKDKKKATIAAISTALLAGTCLLYTSPSPRDRTRSRMPSSA